MDRGFESSLFALARQNHFNRQSVFDVLAEAGITSVVVETDLSRDVELIVNISCKAGRRIALLPAAMLRVSVMPYLLREPTFGHVTLTQAIEGMLRDFFELIPGELPDHLATFELEVAERRLALRASIQTCFPPALKAPSDRCFSSAG